MKRISVPTLVVLFAFSTVGFGLTKDDLQNFWIANSDFSTMLSGGDGAMPPESAVFQQTLLAKAKPDECFCGVPPMGPPYPVNPTNNPPPCTNGCTPKVNDAYVWGLTLAGSNLWFGTAANVLSEVLGGFLQATNPIQTESFVCEFGHSYYSQVRGVPAAIGDWRPPHLYAYNLITRTLIPKDGTNTLSAAARLRLAQTLGIRSAGTSVPDALNSHSIVFMAGPALVKTNGLNIFAFDAGTGNFLAATNLPAYVNIRKWLVRDGVLYTSVGNLAGGGTVLRWLSDPAGAGYPFAFEVVGQTDSQGAELAFHEGRIFVNTWPDTIPPTNFASLWMSPVIPTGGLHNVHATQWQQVWRVDNYEPDHVTAMSYGGGALASFDGYLYWGTMHVPGVSMLYFTNFYGTPTNQDDATAAGLGTYRAISIFRGRNFGQPASPSGEVQIVYGLAQLPVFNATNRVWELRPNNMGMAPLYGSSGFGNMFNNYTWTMEVYGGELYVGTMDCSFVGWDMLPMYLSGLQIFELQSELNSAGVNPYKYFGADLFRFRSSSTPASLVSRDGMGNYLSYGIRTMVADSNSLYLGMANPMNLMTDTNDDKPEGGWELIALKKNSETLSDYNGDGKSDLAVYDRATGNWFVRSLATNAAVVFGLNWGNLNMIPVPGDYDGDGKNDLTVYDQTNGKWYIWSLARHALILWGQQWGGSGFIPVPGDYDGDGLFDLAVYQQNVGNWYVRSLGGKTISWGLNWGAAGMTPVPGDYDGDGLADLAMYQNLTGNWFIRSLTKNTAIVFGQNWGGAGLNPVPGDFNGDKVTDLAVYQPSTGRWFIRSLGTNVPVVFGLNWGAAGMTPLSGDYDGDGRCDLAVYFPPTGGWYIRSLTNNTPIAFGQNWGTPAMLPVGARR